MRFLNSLAFKIWGIVIAIEVVALAAVGFYYNNRFGEQVDRRVVQNVQLPGKLMARGLLGYDVVADHTIMRQLVGEELVDGMVVGVNGNIFHALNPDDLGKNVAAIPDIDSDWFGLTVNRAIVEKVAEGKDTYFVSITPLSAAHGRTPFLFAYIKAQTNEAEAEKMAISWLFIIGVTLSVGLTSAVILVSFQGIILTRLKDVVAVIRCFETGDLTARVRETPLPDEIGILQNGVNSMAAKLEETIETLEQQFAERKQAEQSLRNSEDRYRRLFEDSPISLWEEDFSRGKEYLDSLRESGITDFRAYFENNPEAVVHCAKLVQVLDVNKATLDLLRAKDKDELLAGLPTAFTEDSLEVFREELIILAEGRLRFESEAAQRALTGEEKQVALQLVVAPGYEDSLSKVLVSLVDITDQKRVREEIHRLNAELEQRVLDRTVELAAINKELEAFAYSVSHDLRAPLRHIDGFLGLLKKKAGTAPDDQSRHYMDAISGAANKMGQLIDELLSFSRMARNVLSFQKVALEEMVRKILREFKSDTRGRKIDWRIGNLPVIRGDGAMLRIVLVNLISNALKYTSSREKATIEIGSLPDQTSETVIFVRDNGVGFDMTYVDKLFGVFQRLHSADEFEGTGIGLATVRRIIDRHGGRIWAEGNVDQGATFYFSLPQIMQEA